MGALGLLVGHHLLIHTSLVLVESALAFSVVKEMVRSGRQGLVALSQLHEQE